MAGEIKATIVAMEVEENKAQGYTKVTDEQGEMYSVWDEKLQKLFKVGGIYEITYKTKGSYKNIATAKEVKPTTSTMTKAQTTGTTTNKPEERKAPTGISEALWKQETELMLKARDFVLENFDKLEFPDGRHTFVNALVSNVSKRANGK